MGCVVSFSRAVGPASWVPEVWVEPHDFAQFAIGTTLTYDMLQPKAVGAPTDNSSRGAPLDAHEVAVRITGRASDRSWVELEQSVDGASPKSIKLCAFEPGASTSVSSAELRELRVGEDVLQCAVLTEREAAGGLQRQREAWRVRSVNGDGSPQALKPFEGCAVRYVPLDAGGAAVGTLTLASTRVEEKEVSMRSFSCHRYRYDSGPVEGSGDSSQFWMLGARVPGRVLDGQRFTAAGDQYLSLRVIAIPGRRLSMGLPSDFDDEGEEIGSNED